MLRKIYWVFVAVVLIAAVMGTASCNHPSEIQAEGAPKASAVAVTRVTRGDISRELELAAEFRPFQEIEVHAKVAGYLKQIAVDIGDHVKAGQVLAALEIPEMAQDLDQATASMKRAQSEVLRAREEVTRSESAYNAIHLSYTRLAAVIQKRPNLVAQQESDDALARDRVAETAIQSAKAALASAEGQVDVAKANEARARTLMAYSQIVAPFAGVITKRYADLGAMIQAGTASQTQAMPVVQLSQIDHLRLVLPVPESNVPGIRVGMPVRVRLPALGRTFNGKVSRMSGKIDASTRTMETEIDVPNPTAELLPGMYAYSTIEIDHHRNVLVVPTQAVSGHDTNPTIMVVTSQGELEERKVKLGAESATQIEIAAGADEGQLVVVGSRSQLKNGQPVNPKLMTASDIKGDK